MKNSSLNNARKKKNDEFYTIYEDIEKEVSHYKQYFKDKIVYCNCDGFQSNFYKYFRDHFNDFRLKELWCTSLENKFIRVTSEKETVTEIDGNMFSEDCLYLLRKSDIVVTNPPFSLFREYISQLIEYDKKFLIIGSLNALTYKEIFPLIKNNKLWFGCGFNKTMEFIVPKGYKFSKELNGIKYGKVPAITWFTNLPNKKRNEEMILYKSFNPLDYPKYDNYIAWNVDKTREIPMDTEIKVLLSNEDFKKAKIIYNDDCELLDINKETGECQVLIKRPIWGVPISFLDKYNPSQFEIYKAKECITDTIVGGTYRRVLVRKN